MISCLPCWLVLEQCSVSPGFETSTTHSTLPIKRHTLNVSPTSFPHLMVSIDVRSEEGSPYSDPFQNQISRNALYFKTGNAHGSLALRYFTNYLETA